MTSNHNDPTFFLSRQQTLNSNLRRINTSSLRSLHPLVDRAIINITRAVHFFRGLKDQRMTQDQRDHLGTLGDGLFYLAVQFEKEAWNRWYYIKDRPTQNIVNTRIVELERQVDRVRKAVENVWRSYHLEVQDEKNSDDDEGNMGDEEEYEEAVTWQSDCPGE